MKSYRKQEVGDMLSTSLYCGVVVYGNKVVDFTEV
jgi:hypothetical protein